MIPPSPNGRMVHVDDIDIWVETSGEGPPMILLGGGFATTVAMASVIEAFAQRFHVFAVDPRGHGRSDAGEGPITYGRMAADAARLMDVLGLNTAHVYGHSDGGCVGLHLLFDFPHKIRSAVLSGTPFNRSAYDAATDRFCKELPQSVANGTDPLGIAAGLLSLGLTEEKVRRLALGLRRAWATSPNFTIEMLADLDRPVLVVEAGADQFIALEHFETMTRTIPGARAIRIPTMTHDPRPEIAAVVAAAAEMAAAVDAGGAQG